MSNFSFTQARINNLWQLNGRCKLRRDIWKNKHLFAFLKINAVRNKPITKRVYSFYLEEVVEKSYYRAKRKINGKIFINDR
ncbi:hypothetical protein [Caldithrix abyssi]|uniref:hypothetical protein n=1 Tax=Caldithrix abyssi TaxID=187145 RepID=UPI001471C464|nr:hypothetical protein [Caldithrix abyssi]